ncbi:MAG: glycosyltransferase family 4 protein [Acidimicrobiales bacterium]
MTADAPDPVAVSLDVTAVPANPSGAGRYTIDLAAALSRRDDVQLTFVSRRGDAARWEALSPGAAVVADAPRSRPVRLAWEQARLPRLLRGLQPPVRAHHSPHYTMPESSQLPTVVTVHDLTFFDHPEWHERGKVALFRRAIRVAARHAEAVVCVSRATADRLAELCPAVGQVRVIPHGVDLSRFTHDPGGADDTTALAALGVYEPFVAFVGTIEPRKDVPTLVKAFDRMAPQHSDLSLVLAGVDGWGAKAVNAAVAAAAHGNRVVRTGYVPDEAVPSLLRRASAVAYPSLEEGFGLPALEALACGAPLVTTTGSAMEEMASGSAMLVDPGDADGLAGILDMLVRGDAGLDARRQRGLAVAARHTWEASGKAHADLYRSVAG